MQTATRPLLRRSLLAAAVGAAALAALAVATLSSPVPTRSRAAQHAANRRSQVASVHVPVRDQRNAATARGHRPADSQLGIAPRPATPAWSRGVGSPADVRHAMDRLPHAGAFEAADTDGIRERLEELTR